MKKHSFHRDNCRCCLSKEIERVLELTPTPVGDAYLKPDQVGKKEEPVYPVDLYLCKRCGMVQLGEVVDPEVLYGSFIYLTQISLGLPEHFQAYAKYLLQRYPQNKDGFVIDIGSNDGTLLKCFKEAGVRSLGIEPAPAIAKAATDSGMETLPELLTIPLAKKIRDERGPASLVLANNVMANIDDMVSFAKSVDALLAPDGVFIFETGYVVELVANSIYDNIYHEHLSYFSVKPLAQFFEKNGMELFDVEKIDTKGGSIRGYVQRKGGTRKKTQAVQACITHEESCGIHRPEVFRKLGEKLQKNKADLHELLRTLQQKGAKVAGFGAAVGVTTGLYHFGLDRRTLACLYDDNPAKHELHCPGLHLVCHPGKDLASSDIDYAVIMPWRYTDAISRKHAAFTKRGGKFIQTLPDVKILS